MDIHHEVDQILASLQQNHQQLRIEFHPGGCTVILCNSAGEHKYEMGTFDLFYLSQTFRTGDDNHILKMMDAGTVTYFTEHKEPQP